MTPGRRRALAFGAIAAAAAGAGVWLGLRQYPGARPLEGPLNRATFSDLQGKSRSIAEWRGRVVVVNFWATWCAPCREEIPMLMAVREISVKRGLEIVGIAIDNADNVFEFARNMSISYPVLITDGTGLDLVRELGNPAGGLPFTLLLDRSGTTVRTKLGALTRQELDSLLADLLP